MTVIIFVFGLILGSFLSVIFSRLEIDEETSSSSAARSSRASRSNTNKTASKALGRAITKESPSSRTRSNTNDDSILTGRSRCDECRRPIAWYDNIPLVSYLLLRAQCRHCAKPISHYHPLLELCSGLYLATTYLAFGLTPVFAIAGAFGLLLLLIFSYDLKYSLIPNVFVVPGIVAATLLIGVQYLLLHSHSGLSLALWGSHPVPYLLGGLVGGGFFLLLSLLSGGKWIGGGDIKLGLLLGLLLGWPYIIVALILAYLIGTAYAVTLLLSREATLRTMVPFGPMLVLGFFIAEFYGDALVGWYNGWFLG